MKKLILFAFISLAFLNACRNKNQITLSHSNIDEIMPTSGNFTFTFDQIIAPDSILYNWDATEYVEFSPQIDGQFKWISANELSFSPASSLKPATDYIVHFTNKIASVNKKFNGVNIEDILFSTAPLQVSDLSAFWFWCF